MAVRIRMKRMGRTHRPFYRVCATDHKTPRDGRVLEELGTYDTGVPDTDARALLNKDRIDYWLSVGAKPSNRVSVLIKKYGTDGTHVDAQAAAIEKLSQPKILAPVGAPASLPTKEEPAAPATEEKAAAPAKAKAEETKAEETKAEETKAEETKAEEPKAEEPKAEETKAEEPKAEETKAEETQAEEPKAEATNKE